LANNTYIVYIPQRQSTILHLAINVDKNHANLSDRIPHNSILKLGHTSTRHWKQNN